MQIAPLRVDGIANITPSWLYTLKTQWLDQALQLLLRTLIGCSPSRFLSHPTSQFPDLRWPSEQRVLQNAKSCRTASPPEERIERMCDAAGPSGRDNQNIAPTTQLVEQQVLQNTEASRTMSAARVLDSEPCRTTSGRHARHCRDFEPNDITRFGA